MRKMPTLKNIKVRHLKPREKSVAVKTLPILQIVIMILGIAITAYLNGKTGWLFHSVSYLATVGDCVTPFATTLISTAVLGYSLTVISIWTLLGRAAVLGRDLQRKSSFVVFTVAYLCLVLIALVPTSVDHSTWNYPLHITAALGFFTMIPLGILVFSNQLPSKYRTLKRWSPWFVWIYFFMTGAILIFSGSYVLVETVDFTIMGLWSFLLANVVARKIVEGDNYEG